ncbi:MAG: hypothetical protein F6K31_11500 [Symploca sp. SIO2G7]|nr:hypothetical protein [Symploca sp. SIO2G7]
MTGKMPVPQQNSLLWNNPPVEQASSLWQSQPNHDLDDWQDASSTDNSLLWNNLQWNRLQCL